jgi:hypothetical protein
LTLDDENSSGPSSLESELANYETLESEGNQDESQNQNDGYLVEEENQNVEDMGEGEQIDKEESENKTDLEASQDQVEQNLDENSQ